MRREIRFSRRFEKELEQLTSLILRAFKERYALFLENEYSPLLKNHPLVGEWKGCRSINITGDWRAIFSESGSGEIIIFLTIGTHSQLYGN